MKTFREFYQEKYGPYPGYSGERFDIVLERIAIAIAEYLDYVIEEKFKEKKC